MGKSARATLITKCKPLHCLPMGFAGKQRDCLQWVLREKYRNKYNTSGGGEIEFSPLFQTHAARGEKKILFLCFRALLTKRRRKGNKKKFADGVLCVCLLFWCAQTPEGKFQIETLRSRLSVCVRCGLLFCLRSVGAISSWVDIKFRR
jgi:hypothetical protein